MEQAKLFEIEEVKILDSPITARCKNCNYIYQHRYGKMFYCEKFFDKKTSYGNKKIKANNKACHYFELR